MLFTIFSYYTFSYYYKEFILLCFCFNLQSGATIVIRGKGSVKEGKLGFKDGKMLPGQDEPLHAYVTSTKMESVQMACEKVSY